MEHLEFTETALQEQLDAAEVATRIADATEPRAHSAYYDPTSGHIVIHLKDGSIFMFPHRLGQGLAHAHPNDLTAVEVTPSGQGLHWEALDVDLTIPSLLRGIYGTQAWMQQLRQQQNAA